MRSCYFAGDVESSVGTVTPPLANMVSFALCEVGNPQNFFYAELKLLFPEQWDPRTETIHRITRAYLETYGKDPREVMERSAHWVHDTARGRIPVYCAMPIRFDHSYMDWYYQRVGIPNPFIQTLDGRDQYRSIHDLPPDAKVKRKRMFREFPTSLPHTHHALSDTFEYEEVVAGVLRAQGLL